MVSPSGRVGVVGLGKMGRPIARHLLRAGYEVLGCDASVPACADAANEGIAIAVGHADLARRCDLVILLLGFDAQVEAVMSGSDGILAALRPGAAVALGSTVAPQLALSLAERCIAVSATLLDTPISRGEQAAEAGTLLMFGAGDPEVFERWRPAFASFAESIFHLGPAGAGQVAKMVNNLIVWACMSANYEGLKLAAAMGLSDEVLRPALVASSAQNWALETRAENRPIPWAEKDMMLVLQEADRAGLSLPLCGLLKEVIKGIKLERGLYTPQL